MQITSSEIQECQKLFAKNLSLYEIDFISLYTVPLEFIILLYEQIYILHQDVEINIDKNRLSKYLHSLGFQSNFISSLSTKQIKNPNPNILIIGGSANSSEKIIKIFSKLDMSRFTTFIIQHIDQKSAPVLDSVLFSYTDVDIFYAKDGMPIKKSSIYIAPPNKHFEVSNNTIVLHEGPLVNFARPSISVSFKSLAQEYQENALFILECGYAEDGVDSLSSLKQHNSFVIIQDPDECKASSIPLAALETKQYDYKLKVHEIIEILNIFAIRFQNKQETINFLFDKIYEKYEYDFRAYQEDYIQRRLSSFMIKHNIKDIKSALILILYYRPAFKSLFLDLSINVTEFFRDEKSIQGLYNILQNEYKNSYKIKIWSAGCSTGEEVYSMGVLLKQLNLLDKSLIYATDFNPVVIEEAKNGIYSIKQFKKAQENYNKLGYENNLENEFDRKDNFVKIKETLKKNILFFTHNLEKDSVFNEFDIIECKNVLIYFNEKLQIKIFNLLYESLKFGGYLALGSSEILPMKFDVKFQRYGFKNNIYKKVS